MGRVIRDYDGGEADLRANRGRSLSDRLGPAASRDLTEDERDVIARFFGRPTRRERAEYCSQNGGKCWTCSLSSYGRDCRNNPC